MIESCTLKTRVQTIKEADCFGVRFLSTYSSNILISIQVEEKKMAKIKKMLQSDLKITVIWLRQ